jgi:TonB family protein
MKALLITVTTLAAVLPANVDAGPTATPSGTGQWLYAPHPHYPKPYLDSGKGLFALHFRPDGRVSSVTVEKSTGHKTLDDEAVSTFAQWRCRPGAYTVIRIPLSFTRNGR